MTQNRKGSPMLFFDDNCTTLLNHSFIEKFVKMNFTIIYFPVYITIRFKRLCGGRESIFKSCLPLLLSYTQSLGIKHVVIMGQDIS